MLGSAPIGQPNLVAIRIDPNLQGRVDYALGSGLVYAHPEIVTAQSDLADFETRNSQTTTFHGAPFSGSNRMDCGHRM